MLSRRNRMTSAQCLLTCLVVATICIVEMLCACTDRSEYVEKNIGLAETHFWGSKAQDLDQCMQMCVRRKPCNSINYDFLTKVCQLNTGIKDNTPTTSGEMLAYSQFDWWPATFDEHCHSRPCADDEVCIPGILDFARGSDTCSYTCMPAGRIVCPMPESGLNGGRYVGDINEWTCGHGLAGSDTATCLPSGQWDKEINPTCEEIHGHQCTEDAFCSTINADCDSGNCACRPNMEYDSTTRMCLCGSPPSPVNAVIVSNDDTTATYACAQGYIPKVPSGEPTRTCSLTTGWTPSTNYECYTCENDPPDVDGATLSELSSDRTRTYTCGPDPIKQRLNTGNGTIRCLETGAWETTTFACYGLRLTPSPAAGIPNIAGTAVGYLEIYKDGWHNVCYDKWNWQGTLVACRSLGYKFGGSFHKDWYDLKDQHTDSVPDSIKSYKLNNLNCDEDGQGLELCDYNWADCDHDKDMVLTCFDYDFQAESSVQIKASNELWVTLDGVSKPLCHEHWSNKETEISCKTVNSNWRKPQKHFPPASFLEAGIKYYNWQCGVRVRANLSQIEDWATQNGLEDEFSQMFERLLAVSELLATSKNTLIKYQWPMMKTHFQPLTTRQLYHVLTYYQLGGKQAPVIWTPPREEMDEISTQDLNQLPLSTHPPFALPDNCGLVDLIRSPEDTSFWTHLRRLKSLYGTSEDDSDSGFSISNTPRGSSTESKSEMADPFYEQENKDTSQEVTKNGMRNGHSQSVYDTILKKQKLKVPIKRSNTNPWACKVPKPGTGVCNCGNESSNDLDADDTLASDLMKVEHRDHVALSDASKELKDGYAKPNKPNVDLSNGCQNTLHATCKMTTKDKMPGKIYEKRKGDVADISASTLPKSIQIRHKNKLKQIQNKINQVHSFSVEDLPLRLLRHRPSASFEEAIERGYTSDTFQDNKSSSVEADEDIRHKATVSDKPRALRNGVKRHKSLVSGSVTSDDVFLDENTIDNLYKDYLSDLMEQRSNKEKANGKLVSSLKQSSLRLKTLPQKLTSVSFESVSRRSSLELTKDDLFINNVDVVTNEVNSDNEADERQEPEVCEAFPGELFTEVSESTLAAMKRHGSSLNIDPSSENNSPRTFTYEQVSEVLGPDEKKRMSPCPMFTVYLQKTDIGFGLSLIDGLHTTLCLSGIYIRKILPDSPAATNGCLQLGDRILAVDGKSVIGASYQSTMNTIKDAGSSLTLLVARGNESIASKVSVSQV